MADAPLNDPAYEEVVFIDKAKRYYKKCIIHNDRLVGAILIGDKTEFLEFRDLIQNKIRVIGKTIGVIAFRQKSRTELLANWFVLVAMWEKEILLIK